MFILKILTQKDKFNSFTTHKFTNGQTKNTYAISLVRLNYNKKNHFLSFRIILI